MNTGNLKPAWKPGQSGNPSGRRKDDPEVMEVLLAACPAAAKKLVSLIRSKDNYLAMRACESILNRCFGTPRQQVEMTGEGVRFVIEVPATSSSAEEWEREAAKLNGRSV